MILAGLCRLGREEQGHFALLLHRVQELCARTYAGDEDLGIVARADIVPHCVRYDELLQGDQAPVPR
jgi:hypothetical protein